MRRDSAHGLAFAVYERRRQFACGIPCGNGGTNVDCKERNAVFACGFLQIHAKIKTNTQRKVSMEYFEILGGNSLFGRTTVHGAKNAVLPLLAAGILSEETVSIEDCPYISDVDVMCRLLEDLGARVEREGRRICVRGKAVRARASESLCKDMRSSMFMLGALLASLGEAEIPFPGGCKIGSRPLDIHVDGLRKMGAEVEYTEQGLHCHAGKLHGADVLLKYPSVGATENLLMCAALAKGKTTLINAAREPEIVSLARGLRAMGARVSGEGTPVIRIDGVDKLGGCAVTPVFDRIVAGTVLCAVAMCGGDVIIEGASERLLGTVCDTLRSKDCKITSDGNSMHVISTGRVHPVNILTAPYPLFPTDMQPQLLALSCFADGVSEIHETVFENRFAHAEELKKMGAHIYVNGNGAIIDGNPNLADMCSDTPRTLISKDLRGGAGLMLAGLKAKGETRVFGTQYIDRGYERIEDVFCALGGSVRRKNEG